MVDMFKEIVISVRFIYVLALLRLGVKGQTCEGQQRAFLDEDPDFKS